MAVIYTNKNVDVTDTSGTQLAVTGDTVDEQFIFSTGLPLQYTLKNKSGTNKVYIANHKKDGSALDSSDDLTANDVEPVILKTNSQVTMAMGSLDNWYAQTASGTAKLEIIRAY